MDSIIQTMNRMRNYLIIALISSAGMSYGQSADQLVLNYMNAVRTDQLQAVPSAILNNEAAALDIIASLGIYAEDTLEVVRRKAYYIVKRIGEKSTDTTVRQQVVSFLMNGVADTDRGISGYCSESLSGFDRADFSQADRNRLGEYLIPQTPHFDQVIQLAGYLGEDGYRNALVSITDSEANFTIRWASRLARARMGDPASIDYILRKLQQAPINDDFVYDIVPDLVYTRQLEIIKFLEGIIQNEEKNCSSADPDANTKILCGYRVIEYLAPVIENFPLPIDEFGELEIDNYENALIIVREWFSENTNYIIKNDAY